MHGTTHHLPEILILLTAAVCVVAFFRMLRLSPVLGYLVAGALIGPAGFGFIKDISSTASIAEYGVVFLLFMIGLELSLDRLMHMRRKIFGIGGLQVLLTSLFFYAVARYFGVSVDASIIIAGGLALSSTAIVLQLLEEQSRQATQGGRLALAVLLLQDLAVVPLLVLVPLLAQDEGSIAMALANASFKAIIALVVIVVVGKLLLAPVLRAIASVGRSELFLATTLLIVLGVSWATGEAGLSLALGAFMAGLLIAETEFQHQVEADIAPYRDLFLGLFFMTVGMVVDIRLIIHDWQEILSLALGIILIKGIIIAGIFMALRYPLRVSLETGLLLAQGGEFAFVLFGIASEQGVMEKAFTEKMMVAVAISMALTPMVAALGRWFPRTKAPYSPIEPETEAIAAEAIDMDAHVIIVGFNRLGHMLGRLLMTETIPFIAIDQNPAYVQEGRRQGKPVYVGDGTRPDIYRSMKISRASAAVVTLKDTAQAEKVVRLLRSLKPDMPIIARARSVDHFSLLHAAGATIAISEDFEGSLQLGITLLRTLDVPENEIDRIKQLFRARHYALAED